MASGSSNGADDNDPARRGTYAVGRGIWNLGSKITGPAHQLPGTLKKGGNFRLYPQCGNCSDRSGGSIGAQGKKDLTRPGFNS